MEEFIEKYIQWFPYCQKEELKKQMELDLIEIIKLPIISIAKVDVNICDHPADMRVNYRDWTVLCTKCHCIISQYDKEINPPCKL